MFQLNNGNFGLDTNEECRKHSANYRKIKTNTKIFFHSNKSKRISLFNTNQSLALQFQRLIIKILKKWNELLLWDIKQKQNYTIKLGDK